MRILMFKKVLVAIMFSMFLAVLTVNAFADKIFTEKADLYEPQKDVYTMEVGTQIINLEQTELNFDFGYLAVDSSTWESGSGIEIIITDHQDGIKITVRSGIDKNISVIIFNPLPVTELTITTTNDNDIVTVLANQKNIDSFVCHLLSGNDVFNTTNTPVIVYGDNGADNIQGGDMLDKLYGGAGNDFIDGGSNSMATQDDNYIFGGSGDDIIVGGVGIDIIYGQSGMDTINGSWGNDIIHGGDDNDDIYGDVDDDVLHGNDGDDSITGVFGSNIINGGAGIDTIKYNSSDTISPQDPQDVLIVN